MDIEDEMQSHGLDVSDVYDMQKVQDCLVIMDLHDETQSLASSSDASSTLSCTFTYDLDDLEIPPMNEVRDTYKILTEADIRQCQEEDISRLSTLLSVPRASAILLLLYYKWKFDAVQEAWFADEDKVRKAVGLLAKPVVQIDDETNLTCDICSETYSRDKMDAASCGHLFCIECLKPHVSKSIRDGGCGGLMLHCPHVSCNSVIGQDMIDKLACEEDKAKYSHDLVRSYLEGSRTAKWCPSPGCDCAVVFEIDISNARNYCNVRCNCSYSFCWNCSEEYHWPVDCDTVANWVSKNNCESVDTKWLLDKTNPCPHCSKPIEKDMGCMQIVCHHCRMASKSPLGYQFCWYCLGALSDDHDHQCNSYTGQSVSYRNHPDRESNRHFHYYQRWLANHSSRLKALEVLDKMVTEMFEELLDKQHITDESEVDFVTEAWQGIAECRRVLKWSYAYGYYIPEDQILKKNSFEYFQGQAESVLERLHQYAEKEIQPCLNSDLFVIRDKIIQLTEATRTAFAILVKALENGVSDDTSQPARCSCEHCTFTNVESATVCEVCSLPRSGCS